MKHVVLSTLATLAACTASRPPPLQPQVQPGPAAQVKPGRVLVLQASCGSLEFKCPKEYMDTVDAIVRSTLEFSGMSVVPAEQLRLDTRQRSEKHDSSTVTTDRSSTTSVTGPFVLDRQTDSQSQTVTASESSTIWLDGSNFDDLSVTDRQAVLAQSGADSVITIRIVVGALQFGWTENQNVEVMVKLGVNQGDTMAWASRCMASSNDFSTVTSALENAARCAVHGGTGR